MLQAHDITALAEALAPQLARLLRQQEQVGYEHSRLVSLPSADLKKIQQEKMRRFKAEQGGRKCGM